MWFLLGNKRPVLVECFKNKNNEPQEAALMGGLQRVTKSESSCSPSLFLNNRFPVFTSNKAGAQM